MPATTTPADYLLCRTLLERLYVLRGMSGDLQSLSWLRDRQAELIADVEAARAAYYRGVAASAECASADAAGIAAIVAEYPEFGFDSADFSATEAKRELFAFPLKRARIRREQWAARPLTPAPEGGWRYAY